MIFVIMCPSVFENWAKIVQNRSFGPLGGPHWLICGRSRSQKVIPICTHTPNLKGLSEIFFELSCSQEISEAAEAA